MYQPPKCPYSYFSKALEFYFRVFFPCILKIDLNAVEIRTVQDYVWPLAFESWFSINRRIAQYFVGDIAIFCFDIKDKFFIFHKSLSFIT